MNNYKSKIASLLLLTFVLYACSGVISQTTEAVTSNPPTATTSVPSITTTPSDSATQRQATATWYLKTATTVLPTPPPDDIGYYEGIIVITQYYTFLGHGLYEEAYQLLSSSEDERFPNLGEYIENGEKWFKKVKIISIVPSHSPKDSINRRRFVVQIIAWGEGRMSGAAMSGEVQTIYLTLVKEFDQWKIESGSTP